MVNQPQTHSIFSVTGVRYQQPGKGAILLVVDIGSGQAKGQSAVLRIPARLAGFTAFHRSQTLEVRGQTSCWKNRLTGELERQIQVLELHYIRPRGEAWIDFVANNPAMQGIGKARAKRIWDAFGEDVFEVLAKSNFDALTQAVPELGPERIHRLLDAWKEVGQERLVEWLDRHRLPRNLCVALTRAYHGQDDALALLEADPYRLLAFGSGWKPVDDIALSRFGISKQDPRRLHASVVEALMREYQAGSTAMHASTLENALTEILRAGRDAAAQGLNEVYQNGGFVAVGADLFQLRGAHIMERMIATDLARRAALSRQCNFDLGRDDVLNEYELRKGSFKLTKAQRQAVLTAASHPLSVIIGGAGTGKTACLEALHWLVEREQGGRGGILQMALAGRAAKRMKDATKREAMTIAGFLHTVTDERLAKVTHVVIDEASMLDVPSFYAVLKRLNGKTRLVLVGDDFQLPPVGSGKILQVLSNRNGLSITVLDQVWRQQAGNAILNIATAVREGSLIDLPTFNGIEEGVSLIAPGVDVAQTVRDIFSQLNGADVSSDLCILAARRQTCGAINAAVHTAFFSRGGSVIGREGDTGFRVGDRFVCNVNHWDIDLMNGSLGRIIRPALANEIDEARIAREESDSHFEDKNEYDTPLVLVDLDGRQRLLGESQIRDCSWGYALTCHRAQGSDFERVVVVLDDYCDRSWLYTAITRGRKQVVLIGTMQQLERACRTSPRVDERVVALPVLLDKMEASDVVGNA